MATNLYLKHRVISWPCSSKGSPGMKQQRLLLIHLCKQPLASWGRHAPQLSKATGHLDLLQQLRDALRHVYPGNKLLGACVSPGHFYCLLLHVLLPDRDPERHSLRSALKNHLPVTIWSWLVSHQGPRKRILHRSADVRDCYQRHGFVCRVQGAVQWLRLVCKAIENRFSLRS